MTIKSRLAKAEQRKALHKATQERRQELISQSIKRTEIPKLKEVWELVQSALRLFNEAEVQHLNPYDEERLNNVRLGLVSAYFDLDNLVVERGGQPELSNSNDGPWRPSYGDAISDCYTEPTDDNEDDIRFDIKKFESLPADRQKLAKEAIRLKAIDGTSELFSDEERVLAGEDRSESIECAVPKQLLGAAMRAGYSPRTALVQGIRALRNPSVRESILVKAAAHRPCQR